MLKILCSDASTVNPRFREVARRPKEDNLAWLSRNISDDPEYSYLVLVGGRSLTSFRLRVAQSHVRHDLTPSYWSHVALLGKVSTNLPTTTVHEISLEPAQGFGFPPSTNGAQEAKLSQYRDTARYPNIAVITLPVKRAALEKQLHKFRTQRAVLDALELLVMWLPYLWGVGQAGNPLLEGHGIPSAAMIEVVASAAGYELTPGLTSRASCPEAVWQSALWWHPFYEREKRQGLSGAYWADHSILESHD